MTKVLNQQQKTPDWLAYLMLISLLLFLGISRCNQEKLFNKFEEKYINE